MEFEKEFVRFMPDDELKGKKVIYADDTITLQARVLKYVSGNGEHFFAIVTDVREEELPFGVNGNIWRFVYYDPYLELKKAHKQGKVIELYNESDYEWFPLEEEPDWYFDPSHYRIAKEPLITNKEFARWAGSNLGQWKYEEQVTVHAGCFYYVLSIEDEPIMPDILVRKWDDTEWVKPTRAYLGLDN